jgi:hypothetical protein
MKENLVEKINYLIERDGLNKRNRHREIIYKKCFLMHRLRKEELSLSEVGSFFGQHHASVLHNIETHKNMMKYNKDEYVQVIREYQVFLRNTEYIVEPRDLISDIMDCTNLYKVTRVKRWIKEGRYKTFNPNETDLE